MVDESALLDLKHLLMEAQQRVPPVLMALEDPDQEMDEVSYDLKPSRSWIGPGMHVLARCRCLPQPLFPLVAVAALLLLILVVDVTCASNHLVNACLCLMSPGNMGNASPPPRRENKSAEIADLPLISSSCLSAIVFGCRRGSSTAFNL